MDKRAVIFIFLAFVILMGWQILFVKEQPPAQPTGPEPAPALEEPYERETGAPESEPVPDAPEAEPSEEAVGAEAEEEVEIRNDLFHVVLTNRGGVVRSWKLKEYTGADGEDLEVLPCFEGNGTPLPLAVDMDDPVLADAINDALYVVEKQPVYPKGGLPGGEKVVFTWSDGRGLEILKELTFRNGQYLVEVDLQVIDRGRRLSARMTWGPGFDVQDGTVAKGPSSYYAYTSQVAMNLGGNVTRKKSKKVEAGGFTGRVVWAGLEDQYFTALFVPGTEQSQLRQWTLERQICTPAGEDEPGKAVPQALVSVSIPPEGALLYVGPKKYVLLRDQGHQLGKAVWFSSNAFLGAIAKVLFLALLWIHDNIIRNYGMAIILATMALRIVLFPLNQFSMVRMRKTQVEMQRIQPKISAIKKKYQKHKDAESRAKMNKEMMELYQKEGVSPMGGMVGCLPLFAQFPILIGFYNMLTVAIELRGAPFYGWIQDLSVKDPYYITPILMGVTMFLQQKLSQSKVADPTQKQQQRIMMIMPFFFTYICIQMPSGMVLYWFVNNLLGIGQQWLVNKRSEKLHGAKKKA
jgi:YidC/Oxa1 family membrane protein insertase